MLAYPQNHKAARARQDLAIATMAARRSSESPRPGISTMAILFLVYINAAAAAIDTNGAQKLDTDDRVAGHTPPPVIISEFLPKATDDSFLDEDGDSSDWLELLCIANSTLSLKGWSLVNGDVDPTVWIFPEVSMSPGQHLVVMASDKDKRDPSGQFLHTNFKLKKEGDEYLALVTADGETAWEHNPTDGHQETMKSLPEGLSMGSPPEKLRIGEHRAVPLIFPTPGSINAPELFPESVPEPFAEVMTTITPPDDISSEIVAWAAVNLSAIANAESIELLYTINQSQSKSVKMTAVDGLNDTSTVHDLANFTVNIPQGLIRSGTLLRWKFRVIDSSGSAVSCSPGDCERSYGWVIDADPASRIPELHMWVESPGKAMSAGGEKRCIAYLSDGPVFEDVRIRRRGKSSKAWQKPKLKLDFKDATDTEGGPPPVSEMNLQSFYMEPGEQTYMRETVSFVAMREAGVMAPVAYHVCVYLNGQFLGLFAIVEEVDSSFLERNNRPEGPLYKSVNGQLSNYRHDAEYALRWAYDALNSAAKTASAIQELQDLTWGLAGGAANLTRSQYLYVQLDLPQVINEMAMQTVLHNIDRCTKNFISYFDESTQRWSRIPWDMDSALAIDRRLGGEPYTDYCILACPQWNNPMYCGRDHPQDLVGYWESSVATNTDSGPIPDSMPAKVWEDPNSNRTAWESITGAEGTYNHLIDAVLDVSGTRSMYLRRLQVLRDIYHTNGRLREIITEQLSQIHSVALKDHMLWGAGDPDLGYRQLVEEQLPERQAQLVEMYGHGGTEPIIPAPAHYGLGSLEITTANLSYSGICYVKVSSQDELQALDLSGWSVSLTSMAGQTTATTELDPGTVLPPLGVLLLGQDLAGEIRQMQVQELRDSVATGVLLHRMDLDDQACLMLQAGAPVCITDEYGLQVASINSDT